MNKIQLSIALILLAIAAAAIGAVVIRDDDMDDDGIPNKWEWTHASYSWLDASDAGRDDDADHLATAAEFHAGLDPLNPDSDGDSFRDDLDLRPHDDAQLAFDTAIPPGLMRGEREFSVIGYTSDAVVRKYWDQSEVPASNLDRATYEYHPTPETAWELHQPSLSPGLRFAEAPRETARGPLPPEVVEDCDPLFQTDKHAKCAKITYSPYRVDYVARITNDRERAWYTPSGPHVVAVTQVDIPLGSDSIPVIFQGSYPNDQPLALNVRAFPSRSFLGVEPSIDRTVMATPIEGTSSASTSPSRRASRPSFSLSSRSKSRANGQGPRTGPRFASPSQRSSMSLAASSRSSVNTMERR